MSIEESIQVSGESIFQFMDRMQALERVPFAPDDLQRRFNGASNVPARRPGMLRVDEAVIPHDVWRALWDRFRIGIDHASGHDELRSKYPTQVLQHPRAFDFEGRINYMRSSGSVSAGANGIYCSRIVQYRRLLLEGESWPWPRAVDWIAPEVRDVPEVIREPEGQFP